MLSLAASLFLAARCFRCFSLARFFWLFTRYNIIVTAQLQVGLQSGLQVNATDTVSFFMAVAPSFKIAVARQPRRDL